MASAILPIKANEGWGDGVTLRTSSRTFASIIQNSLHPPVGIYLSKGAQGTSPGLQSKQDWRSRPNKRPSDRDLYTQSFTWSLLKVLCFSSSGGPGRSFQMLNPIYIKPASGLRASSRVACVASRRSTIVVHAKAMYGQTMSLCIRCRGVPLHNCISVLAKVNPPEEAETARCGKMCRVSSACTFVNGQPAADWLGMRRVQVDSTAGAQKSRETNLLNSGAAGRIAGIADKLRSTAELIDPEIPTSTASMQRSTLLHVTAASPSKLNGPAQPLAQAEYHH